jgi:hypothetical protein
MLLVLIALVLEAINLLCGRLKLGVQPLDLAINPRRFLKVLACRL